MKDGTETRNYANMAYIVWEDHCIIHVREIYCKWATKPTHGYITQNTL